MPRQNPKCRRCQKKIDVDGVGDLTTDRGHFYHTGCYLRWIGTRINALQKRFYEYGLKPPAQRELDELLTIRKIYIDKGVLAPAPEQETP